MLRAGNASEAFEAGVVNGYDHNFIRRRQRAARVHEALWREQNQAGQSPRNEQDNDSCQSNGEVFPLTTPRRLSRIYSRGRITSEAPLILPMGISTCSETPLPRFPSSSFAARSLVPKRTRNNLSPARFGWLNHFSSIASAIITKLFVPENCSPHELYVMLLSTTL